MWSSAFKDHHLFGHLACPKENPKTRRHQRGWLKKESAVQVKLGSCSFVQFGSPTASAWRTRFRLALSKTSPAKAVRPRSNDNISTSTRWRCCRSTSAAQLLLEKSLTRPIGILFSTRLPSDFRTVRKNKTQVSPGLRFPSLTNLVDVCASLGSPLGKPDARINDDP